MEVVVFGWYLCLGLSFGEEVLVCVHGVATFVFINA